MMNKKLLVIFLLAFLIRLISLDQSLWLDEGTTAKVVQTYNINQIINQFSSQDFHPPLYYLLMKFWTNIFGYSEVSFRFPSVIFSLLTGLIVYLIGKTLKDKIVGLWATIFFLFNPLIIYYSQEARMYMMATFFLTISIYFLISLCHAEPVSASQLKMRSRNEFRMTKEKYLVLFNIFIVLSFVTFYGSIFLIIPMLLYLIFLKKYKEFLSSFIILNSLFIILSPLLIQQIINSRSSLNVVINWTNVLGKTNLKNLLLISIKFSIGRISFEPKIIYYFVSGVWSVIVLFFTIKGGYKNRLLLFLVIGSLVFGILFSLWSPLLQYFRFIYLIPLISLLISLGLNSDSGRTSFARMTSFWGFASRRRLQNLIILFGFIIFSLIYLLNSDFHREDWKRLSNELKNNSQIYAIISSVDPLRYYRKDIKIIDIRSINNQIKDKRLIIIPYTVSVYGFDYEKKLNALHYSLIKKTSYRGLELEYWYR